MDRPVLPNKTAPEFWQALRDSAGKANELSAETALYQSNTYNAVIIANASERDMKYIHDNPIPIPTVLSNRESELYHTVYIDNIELGRKAARHLLERNVKNIGIISLNEAYFSMNSSTKGFFEVSREHSLILLIILCHRLQW